MRVIVDAWNVLHVTGVLPPGLAGLDLTGLARLMSRSRWISAHPVLVCDGAPQEAHGIPRAIRVLWSGPRAEADDLIEHHIDQTSAPKALTVVSSDRRLHKAARRRGCKVLSSEDFLRTILEDLSGASSPTTEFKDHPGGSPQAWQRTFGLDADDLVDLEADVAQADLPGQCRADEAPQPPPDPPPAEPPPARIAPDAFPAELIKQAMRIARGET